MRRQRCEEKSVFKPTASCCVHPTREVCRIQPIPQHQHRRDYPRPVPPPDTALALRPIQPQDEVIGYATNSIISKAGVDDASFSLCVCVAVHLGHESMSVYLGSFSKNIHAPYERPQVT